MNQLLHQGHLTSYSKFEACRSFVRKELLSIANSEHNEWKEYGRAERVLVDGTTIHPVDEFREFGAIGPIIQMVSAPLLRGIMVLLYDTSRMTNSSIPDTGRLVEIQFNTAPYETPWTTGDVHMLQTYVTLTEQSLTLLKRLLLIWMHAKGGFAATRETMYEVLRQSV